MSPKLGRPLKAKSLKEFFATGAGKKLWNEGKEQYATSGTYNAMVYDDGRYNVQLTDAKSGISKNGRVQNILAFKFIDGEYKGQTIRQYQGVENAIGLSILFQTFKALGHETEDPDDIDNIDKALSKERPKCEIKLVTKGEYQNVFVLKKSEEGDADADVETETEDEEKEETEDVESKPEPVSKAAKKEPEEDAEDDEADAEGDDDSDDEEEVEEKPKAKKEKAPVVEEEDEDEEDEDDDEDEDDEEEKEEKAEEEVALETGMKVRVNYKKTKVDGKIVKIMEEESKIKVKLANGDKIIVSVPADVIDIL